MERAGARLRMGGVIEEGWVVAGGRVGRGPGRLAMETVAIRHIICAICVETGGSGDIAQNFYLICPDLPGIRPG
ncbi:hypothetical protein N007_08880 [Alicyclobacillus acidoterrestris ATCC 49025]|nr:hypothetical protein N007_08880 [Alicyclobacillus acidoterrestris ATCC 49025]